MFKNTMLVILIALSGNTVYGSLDNQPTPLNINQQNENSKPVTKNGSTIGTCTLINGLALAIAYVGVSYIAKDLDKDQQAVMLNSLVGLGLFTTMGCAFAEGVNFLDRAINTPEQKDPNLKKSLELNQNK